MNEEGGTVVGNERRQPRRASTDTAIRHVLQSTCRLNGFIGFGFQSKRAFDRFVKLATELSKRDTGRTFYILDEPTTGLHFEDVRVLLDVLHRLVDRGNTVLVIEHNLDVIKTADWIIDLGPEGGTRGGAVVASGTPEHVASIDASYTGQYLKPLVGVRRKKAG